MTKMAVHMMKTGRNAFGGMSRGSICGRLNARSVDGMNITDKHDEVTCKFCLKQMKRRAA